MMNVLPEKCFELKGPPSEPTLQRKGSTSLSILVSWRVMTNSNNLLAYIQKIKEGTVNRFVVKA